MADAIYHFIMQAVPGLVNFIGSLSTTGVCLLSLAILLAIVGVYYLIKRLVEIAEILAENEIYDAEWMDYEAWKESGDVKKW